MINLQLKRLDVTTEDFIIFSDVIYLDIIRYSNIQVLIIIEIHARADLETG